MSDGWLSFGVVLVLLGLGMIFYGLLRGKRIWVAVESPSDHEGGR